MQQAGRVLWRLASACDGFIVLINVDRVATTKVGVREVTRQQRAVTLTVPDEWHTEPMSKHMMGLLTGVSCDLSTRSRHLLRAKTPKHQTRRDRGSVRSVRCGEQVTSICIAPQY